MYIPDDDKQNYPFCYNTISGWNFKPTNQNYIKAHKVVKATNKITLLWNFGDKCNKQPNDPTFLDSTLTRNLHSISRVCSCVFEWQFCVCVCVPVQSVQNGESKRGWEFGWNEIKSFAVCSVVLACKNWTVKNQKKIFGIFKGL